MDKYICKAKRTDNNEWVDGYFTGVAFNQGYMAVPYGSAAMWRTYPIELDTLCRNTEMTEFVMADKSVCSPLFEGDIVEVHSVRCPYAAYPQSKYDGPVKVRAVICFKRGQWQLDYDNAYNNKICAPRGNEQYERSVENARELYYFGYHGSDEDKHRELNKRCHYHDIVKLGNIHANPELLEG